MAIRRGVLVDRAWGLKLEGDTTVSWTLLLGRLIDLEVVRATIAMPRTPDGVDS